jgi:hypothetical protein
MLILATPTNPGQAAWTPMSSVGGTLIFSAFASTNDSANGTTTDYTPLPNAGITIPANTVQDGDIITLNVNWSVDNSASLNPAVVKLGAEIGLLGPSVSTNTITAAGTINNFFYAAQPTNFGGILGPSTLLSIAPIVGSSLNFDTYASLPTPLTLQFSIFGLLLDYTQPIVLTPGFQMNAINADAVVEAAFLSVQIYRP